MQANIIDSLIQVVYLFAAFGFIFGLKRMSAPNTAQTGIIWAGVGMLLATAATFFHSEIVNSMLILIAMGSSALVSWLCARTVKMTAMPQMIALYNGMGGGAAAAIAAVELSHIVGHGNAGVTATHITLAGLGALIGMVSFSGSLIAFIKLQGWLDKVVVFPAQKIINLLVLLIPTIAGVMLCIEPQGAWLMYTIFFLGFLLLGVLITLPIGGADMPVVISLYNAMTGLAVAFEGFVLNNPAMIIAGIVVGAAGTLLTRLMAKAMNRPISNVLFSNVGKKTTAITSAEVSGAMKEMSPHDAVSIMMFANQVIIIPGYGMAVAQAQHKIAELSKLLLARDVMVKFAIHPVAGRMPGHMNVLLAEAGIDYDNIYDLAEINPEFANTDVTLIIGANDVVNPAARNDSASPIFGMPILNADQAKNILCIKRGKGRGFSGIENLLFFHDNTSMVYGDGASVISKLIAALKELDS